MTKIEELAGLGQSIWYDNIQRSLLDHGDLQALVDAGVAGVTSNPSIFEKAIAGSTDYDQAMGDLVTQGLTEAEIFEALAVEDIRRAADVLRPVYDRTSGVDGYVSLEVSPELAHDTEGTIVEARRLFARLDRPNVMIKVPATPAGIPAIERLISEGININATLMFSVDHYDAVAEAYIAGLERLAAEAPSTSSGQAPSTSSGQAPSTGSGQAPSTGSGRGLSGVASVASFFVSRVDSAVDSVLATLGNEDLLGRIAIANAKVAYERFKSTFSGERWEKLAAQGARVQRPLWASTSTKNPHYPDTLYMDALIGPDTVNTAPPATLEAFMDHGTVEASLEEDLADAHQALATLDEMGIDLEATTQKLQDEGVASFASAYDSLVESIGNKREQLMKEWHRREASLGEHQAAVDAALEEMVAYRIVPRIWENDHTVWRPEPGEIANRLGWLHIAEKMLEQRGRLADLVAGVLEDGYSDVLVLGMGGSSLAPEVFSKVFGGHVAAGMPRLAVLDSTDPGAVLAHAERLDPAKTLFVVSTKSGGTVETLSFFKYFYNWTEQALGQEAAGRHFMAITDSGSKLHTLADRFGFRAIFLNEPNIGGRFSALSFFGLVPAALVGVDIETLLKRSLSMAADCGPSIHPVDGGNIGAWLGAVLGELAGAGRDKATFVISPPLSSFGDWVEQLIAESTGKDGTGILPVVGEPIGEPGVYGRDRLFVYLRLDGDDTYDRDVEALEEAGQPVVRLRLRDLYDLGEQFFLWEMATAVAGYRLGVQPFDQPDVEKAKVLAREAVASFQETGRLPYDEPSPLTADALSSFLSMADPSALSADLSRGPSIDPGKRYVALQAFVQPTPESDAALLALRTRIRDRFRLATTVGYGPRFLHSTGQLHKGDAGHGMFIQFSSDSRRDAAIPDEAGEPESEHRRDSPASGMTFGLLKTAQMLGDKRALLENGRRVIRFHLGSHVADSLLQLAESLP